MERLALVYRVKPEKREEYLEAHRNAWPALLEEMKGAGVRCMYVFERDCLLFLYAEIEDSVRYQKWAAESATNRRWQQWMLQLLQSPFDEREAGVAQPALQEVFAFEA